MSFHRTTAEKKTQSFRSGPRATFYDLQRDPGLKNKDVIRDLGKPVFPFVTGSSYKGEWNMDMKEGLGAMMYPDGSKYEGEWSANRRHGLGTLWIKKGKKLVKQYAGYWVAGVRQGDGTNIYENGEEYIGEWFKDKRHGHGRLNFVNGDYYDGKWEDDQQKGFGVLHIENGNRYEGLWLNGMKEGPGKFYYSSTRKIYEGEWVNDHPKCGEYRDPRSDELNRYGETKIRQEHFTLPPIGLEDPKGVLDTSITSVRLENSNKRGVSTGVFDVETVARAKEAYARMDINKVGSISARSSEVVFEALGINSQNFDLGQIFYELDIGETVELSFPEIIDIAMYIYSNSPDIIPI